MLLDNLAKSLRYELKSVIERYGMASFITSLVGYIDHNRTPPRKYPTKCIMIHRKITSYSDLYRNEWLIRVVLSEEGFLVEMPHASPPVGVWQFSYYAPDSIEQVKHQVETFCRYASNLW